MQAAPPMTLLSINVGLPREVLWKGKKVTTGIFKQPVQGRVQVRRLNLEGDRQADLTVHGGPDKAVYAYPAEHYPYWRKELPGMDLPWGMFGENLTTQGLLEEEVHIGDQFQVGSVILRVTQPRMPCYKLGLKFGRDDIIRKFLWSGRPGIYFSVLEEGEIGPGDTLIPISRDPNAVSVVDIVRLYVSEERNLELLQRAIQVEALPQGWRDYFQELLVKEGSS